MTKPVRLRWDRLADSGLNLAVAAALSIVGSAAAQSPKNGDAKLDESKEQTKYSHSASADTRWNAVCYLPDSNSVLTTTSDGQIFIWDAKGQLKTKVAQKIVGVGLYASAARSKSLFGVVTGRGELSVWDSSRLQSLFSVEVAQTAVNGVSMAQGGELVAVAGPGDEVSVVAVAEKKILRTIRSGRGGSRGVAFSSDGKLIASAHRDGSCCVWDARSGHEEFSHKKHQADVYSVAFSKDGRLLASAGKDKTIVLWNSKAKTFTLLQGHPGGVSQLLFLSNDLLLSADTRGFAVIWDVQTATLLKWYRLAKAEIVGLAVCTKDKYFVLGTYDGKLFWVKY